MAEHFKRKIIGKLSDKPIILKKINPIPKTSIVKPIILVEETIISEEITETIVEEVLISEEITETTVEEPIISEEITETTIEENIIPEETKTKRTRKKK